MKIDYIFNLTGVQYLCIISFTSLNFNDFSCRKTSLWKFCWQVFVMKKKEKLDKSVKISNKENFNGHSHYVQCLENVSIGFFCVVFFNLQMIIRRFLLIEKVFCRTTYFYIITFWCNKYAKFIEPCDSKC